jgi:transcriptional regulator with XRE-family HTH domain
MPSVDDLPPLGRLLRAARIDAGLTGTALGVALGRSEHSGRVRVSRIETGKQSPSEQDLRAWARATGVGADVLAGWLAVRPRDRRCGPRRDLPADERLGSARQMLRTAAHAIAIVQEILGEDEGDERQAG